MGTRPRGAAPGQFAGTIQNGGDRVVRQLPRQHANEINDIGGRTRIIGGILVDDQRADQAIEL